MAQAQTKARGAIPRFSELPPDPTMMPPEQQAQLREMASTPSPFPLDDPSRPATMPAASLPTEAPQPSLPPRRNQRLRDEVKSAIDGTPTPTSDTTGDLSRPVNLDRPPADVAPVEKLTAKAALEVVIGGVGVAVVAAAVLVRIRYRGRRQLREPTDEQTRDIGRPLASLLQRHAGMSKRLPDLIDALGVIGAVGSYANAGPMTTEKHPQAEMPKMEETQ